MSCHVDCIVPALYLAQYRAQGFECEEVRRVVVFVVVAVVRVADCVHHFIGDLGGYEGEGDLLAEAGDESGALHQVEFPGAAVFLPGGGAAGGDGAVFGGTAPGRGYGFVIHRRLAGGSGVLLAGGRDGT